MDDRYIPVKQLDQDEREYDVGEDLVVYEKPKRKWVPPRGEKVKGMKFPMEIMQDGKKIICRQCSSCHGCR